MHRNIQTCYQWKSLKIVKAVNCWLDFLFLCDCTKEWNTEFLSDWIGVLSGHLKVSSFFTSSHVKWSIMNLLRALVNGTSFWFEWVIATRFSSVSWKTHAAGSNGVAGLKIISNYPRPTVIKPSKYLLASIHLSNFFLSYQASHL